MPDQGGAPMSRRRNCGTLNPCSLLASIASTSPAKSRVASASHRRYAQWTALTVLSLVALVFGLDTLGLNVMLPLSDQLGAKGSALRWIDRAEAIATWTWTATVEIGLVAGNLVTTP